MKVFNLKVGSIIKPLLKTLLAQSISTLPLELATKSTCDSYKNKTAYQHNGLTGSKRYLILNPDKPRCGIVVYCPTVKSTIASLTTIATGNSTRSPTNKLICRHEIPDFQPVVTNGSLRIKI